MIARRIEVRIEEVLLQFLLEVIQIADPDMFPRYHLRILDLRILDNIIFLNIGGYVSLLLHSMRLH